MRGAELRTELSHSKEMIDVIEKGPAAGQLQKLVTAVHEWVAVLPRFDHSATRHEIPTNGLYFFFERGEVVSCSHRSIERIVRVGTHRSDGRLPRRVLQHFSGNRRGSVFRYHLGSALLTHANPTDPRIPTWANNKRLPIPEIEEAVSKILRHQFTFCCVRVDRKEERMVLERGFIALLAQQPLGSPSENWLGRHAVRAAIRQSGLWNTQHVEAEPLHPAEFDWFANRLLR